MQDYRKSLREISDLLSQSADTSTLAEALKQTLSIISDMAGELKQLRQDHDDLDGYVCDIEEELDDIEDDLDELWGIDEEDEGWDEASLTDADADEATPVNITPIDSWNRGKE